MLFFAYSHRRADRTTLDFVGALWLIPYLLTLGIVSALGEFGGGAGIIPFGWDIAILTFVAIALLTLAIRARVSHEMFSRRRAHARKADSESADIPE